MSEMPKSRGTVMPFPKEPLRPLPSPVVSVSERGLSLVVSAMLQQLGPTATYNRLVDTATGLRAGITDKGQGRRSGEGSDED